MFHCMGKLHWALILAVVLSFSEMLTFYLRTKRQDTHQSHTSLLSSQRHIHRSRPQRSRCCISRGHKCTLWKRWGKLLSLTVWAARGSKGQQGQQGWPRHHLLMVSSALGCFIAFSCAFWFLITQ